MVWAMSPAVQVASADWQVYDWGCHLFCTPTVGPERLV